MASSELLSIQPGELKFPFELKKLISCSLQLINTTDNYVAFKVKTTSPKKYCVRPNTGIVLPHSSCDVTVTMQAQRETPPDMQCKDKFLVQSVVAPAGTTQKDVSQDMFHKDAGKEVFESKLRVLYVSPPQPPSPVLESPEEGSSPRSSPRRDDGDQNFMATEMGPTEIMDLKSKLAETRAQVVRLTEDKNAAVLKNQQLQQEITMLAVKTQGKGTTEMLQSKSPSGFSFLFVFLVGLLGLLVGYLLRS